ncbi:MAG: hypothetical protein ABI607_04120 [Betaproteobacteria bacterium]
MPAINAEIVIINCSTKELTALALVSALRNGSLPVTVIDCESTDGSVEFFRELQRQLTFKLAHLPLRRHGVTLDRIFNETARDTLLLLDSDAEILDPQLVPRMLAALTSGTYGSGFLHCGEWLGTEHGGGYPVSQHDGGPPGQRGGGGPPGYYADRMWIPCVMLGVAAVKEALSAGQSFRAQIIGNEIAWRWLAQLLCLRFRIPGLRRLRLDTLQPQHRDYRGLRPHYIYSDTGAGLHDFLVNQRGLSFANLGAQWWPRAVAHYHGATRRKLRPRMRNATDVVASRADALARISAIYGVRLPGA